MINRVKVPRLGVNEDMVTIVEWLVKENERINVNQAICSVETSKALFEICAKQSGYLKIRIPAGRRVTVRETIGYITDSLNAIIPEEPETALTARTEKGEYNTSAEEILATKKARDLAQKLRVDLKDINKKGLIRQGDVENFVKANKIKKLISKGKINIAIYGAGKGGQVAKEYAELTNKYKVIYFLDDASELINTCKDGLKVLNGLDMKALVSLGIKRVFPAISISDVRLKLKERLEKVGIEIINLIHPHVYIAPSVKLGKGNFIKAGAVIDTNTKIGDCCIIDNNVVIAHDNIIGDGCHIAPGATLGSSITIGKNSILGIGSNISTNVIVGDDVIIGVGSSVVQDIPHNSIVEGVPGKIIGTRK